jgi:hypothetical protein
MQVEEQEEIFETSNLTKQDSNQYISNIDILSGNKVKHNFKPPPLRRMNATTNIFDKVTYLIK